LVLLNNVGIRAHTYIVLLKHRKGKGYFRKLIKDHGLKWESAKAEDLIISRLTKTNSQGSIVDWIQTVEAKLPRFRVFIDFMLVSGLRFGESVNSFNLIIDLGKKRRLAESILKSNKC
jgi:hypothetical protein